MIVLISNHSTLINSCVNVQLIKKKMT